MKEHRVFHIFIVLVLSVVFHWTVNRTFDGRELLFDRISQAYREFSEYLENEDVNITDYISDNWTSEVINSSLINRKVKYSFYLSSNEFHGYRLPLSFKRGLIRYDFNDLKSVINDFTVDSENSFTLSRMLNQSDVGDRAEGFVITDEDVLYYYIVFEQEEDLDKIKSVIKEHGESLENSGTIITFMKVNTAEMFYDFPVFEICFDTKYNRYFSLQNTLGDSSYYLYQYLLPCIEKQFSIVFE